LADRLKIQMVVSFHLKSSQAALSLSRFSDFSAFLSLPFKCRGSCRMCSVDFCRPCGIHAARFSANSTSSRISLQLSTSLSTSRHQSHRATGPSNSFPSNARTFPASDLRFMVLCTPPYRFTLHICICLTIPFRCQKDI